jgi:hypothetical protein
MEVPGEKAVDMIRFWRRRRTLPAARLAVDAWAVLRFALS